MNQEGNNNLGQAIGGHIDKESEADQINKSLIDLHNVSDLEEVETNKHTKAPAALFINQLLSSNTKRLESTKDQNINVSALAAKFDSTANANIGQNVVTPINTGTRKKDTTSKETVSASTVTGATASAGKISITNLYDIDWSDVFDFDPREGELNKKRNNPDLVKIASPFQGYVDFVERLKVPTQATASVYKAAYFQAKDELKVYVSGAKFTSCINEPFVLSDLEEAYTTIGNIGYDLYEAGVKLAYVYGLSPKTRGAAAIVEKSLTIRVSEISQFRKELMHSHEMLRAHRRLLGVETAEDDNSSNDHESENIDLVESDEEFSRLASKIVKDAECSRAAAAKNLERIRDLQDKTAIAIREVEELKEHKRRLALTEQPNIGSEAITSTVKPPKTTSRLNQVHPLNHMNEPGYQLPPNPYLRQNDLVQDGTLTGANLQPLGVTLPRPNPNRAQNTRGQGTTRPEQRHQPQVTLNLPQNGSAEHHSLNETPAPPQAEPVRREQRQRYVNVQNSVQQDRFRSLESDMNEVKSALATIAQTLAAGQANATSTSNMRASLFDRGLENPVSYYSNIDPLSDSFLSTLPEGFNIRPDQHEDNFMFGNGSTKVKDKVPALIGETNYDSWKASFIHHVYRYRMNIALKVNYLKDTVDIKVPVIRQIVEYVKADAIGFRTIVQKLHQHYGNRKTYRSVLFTRLCNSQTVNVRDRAQLEAFALDLQRYVDNQFREGLHQELSDEANALYQTLASRLSTQSRDMFAQWCQFTNRPLHTLSMLQWLNKVCEMKDDASFYLKGQDSLSQPRNGTQNPVKRREVNFATPNYHNYKPQCGNYDNYNEAAAFAAVQSEQISQQVEYEHENCGIYDEDLVQLAESEACFMVNKAQGVKCPKCFGPHTIDKCADFLALSPTERRDFFIKTYCFCYLCLKQGHLATQCKAEGECHCGKRHHKLLHGANPLQSNRNLREKKPVQKFDRNRQFQSDKPAFRRFPGKADKANVHCVCVEKGTDVNHSDTAQTCHLDNSDSSGNESDEAQVLNTQVQEQGPKRNRIGLRTFPVVVKNPTTGKSQRINALLDDGSTVTMLCDTVAKKLKLPKTQTEAPVQICGIGGVNAGFSTHKVSFTVTSDSGDYCDMMSAQLFNSPCERVAPSFWSHYEGEEFMDIRFGEPVQDKIRLIIGLDAAKYHISLEERTSKTGRAFARKTLLGWTAAGEMSNKDSKLQQNLRAAISEGIDASNLKSVVANNAITANSLLVTCGEPPFRFNDPIEDRKLSEILREQSDLCRFHDDDEIVPKLTEDENYALKTLQDSVRLVETKPGKQQYEVSTLWKREEPNFVSNLPYAIKRLRSTIRNKLSNDTLMDTYEGKLKGWIDSGYTEPSTKAPTGQPEFFLPHFPVIREDKTTTKVRPVMDAAAKCKGPDGSLKCLNDALLEGPKLINSLPEVLLRFRRHRVAVIGDLREMFLQVVLPEQDRRFHKFIWLNRTTNELEYYQFKVHCFGNRSSPAVAIFTIKHHAEKNRSRYPRAAETVLQSTIVDDNCDSVDTVEEALSLIKDLKELYTTAGLDIRKWVSNNKAVLDAIPDSDKAENVVFNYDFDPESAMPKIKALGVIWLAEKDVFTFLSDISKNTLWTKRAVLSAYSKLFDPLGFISPIAVTARIITQACWRHGVDWDEPLPEAILKQWQKWVDDLVYLPQIRVPRCVKPLEGELQRQEFHIFCDASTDGLGAVAYAKSETKDNGCYVNLVLAKARVTPVKSIGINKLELESAVIAVSLFRVLKRVYDIDKSNTYFWTDSKNVLAWLNTRKCLKRFVANRVEDITFSTDVTAWRHVPGVQNPADDLTRGLTAKQLLDSKRWWQGPEFLQHVGREHWPEQPAKFDKHVLDVVNEKILGVPFDKAASKAANGDTLDNINDDFQAKVNLNVTNAPFEKSGVLASPEISRFGSWTRCVNVYCYIWRWITAIRQKQEIRRLIVLKNTKFVSKNVLLKDAHPPHRRNFVLEPAIKDAVAEISSDEFVFMENKLLQLEQYRHFKDDIEHLHQFGSVKTKSSLYQLNPQFDANGVLRVHGRLKNSAELVEDLKRPILLPKRQYVTLLILRHYHTIICSHYGGINYLLSVVRTKFWPINGYSVAKQVIYECSSCNIKKPCPKKQQMATLPEFRLPIEDGKRVFAWQHTACDYGGPFEVKPSLRGRARCKRWLCLFTCMHYRIVHLEVVHSLSTSSFLQAFERFVARNARPQVLHMDNMRTFVKGEEEISKWIQEHNKTLFRSSQFQDIKFEFIPPLSPHFGGVWESLIKLAKRAFYDVIKPGDLNDEQLLTAFTKAEGLLNARPLTNVSSDPDDPKVLTPAHFQVRQAFKELPAPSSTDAREQYLYLQGVLDSFWERFMREVVPLRNKYAKDVKQMKEPYKVGDLVVLLEDIDRQKTWPVARIVQIHTSHDGLVRKATLWFNGKEYKRSIKSFCRLSRATINW